MSGAGATSGELVHLVREPAGEAAGALVLNHGRGADERDLYGLLEALDPERRLLGVTTGAPLTGVPPGGRHWYLVPRVGYPDPVTFTGSYKQLTGFLDALLAQRGIAWERTVIGGFSMGAVMSYAVGLGPRRPSPAAILAFSGFVPTVEGWSPALDDRGGLPVLIHHGRNDPVIGVEFARRARELLAGAGLEVEYLESDAGHWLPPEALAPAVALVATATAPASKPA
ncbi:MAG: phospholipase [Solirubrobacterales bacterium]|jgi:phospholipase/carboxylesterase|nr:phospholipase [Solirubrobacterales bacterium]